MAKAAPLLPPSLAVVASNTTAPRDSMEVHPASALTRDERVQRSLTAARVKQMADNLNMDAVGVLTVSRRANGDLVILDGQHRHAALITRGMSDTPVNCHAYTGLSLADEAALFRLLNNTRAATSMDDYLKGVIAQDPECLAIDRIVAHHGLKVALRSGEGVISCITAIRSLYRRGETGPTALGFALYVATSAWGAHSHSVEGPIISGLGDVYLKHGEQVDRTVMIRKLQKFPGGAGGFLGRAKALHEMRAVTGVAKGAAMAAITAYNRQRGDKALA